MLRQMIEREWIGEVEGENMRSNLADLFVYIFNELKWFAFAVDDWIFAQITTIETQIKKCWQTFQLDRDPEWKCVCGVNGARKKKPLS